MKDENAFVLSAQEINMYVINAFVNKWSALQLSVWELIICREGSWMYAHYNHHESPITSTKLIP